MSVKISQKGQIKTVVVFCGSKDGKNPIYKEHAAQLGALLGQNGYDLVYGGGTSGLMGAVSEAAIKSGSKVTGIITHAFKSAQWYSYLPGVQEHAVKKLHDRKQIMLKKADAVIILPGGIGTLDEQWEAAALIDMSICAGVTSFVKPIIVMNTNGFYDDMKRQMLKALAEGFIHPGRERLIKSVDMPQDVIEKLKEWNVQGLQRACDLAPGAAPSSATPPSAAPSPAL